jgi:hypothetical protein
MKVIVTKDSWGVQVWKNGTDLVYKRPFKVVKTPDPNGTPIEVDSDKVWIRGNIWPLFRRLYNSKQVKKMFPELNGTLKVGDIAIAELDIKVYLSTVSK